MQEISSSNISIGDSSQIRLHATNVSSVGDRILTVGRNIKEAGCNAASWAVSHPFEAGLLAGGAVLATGSVLLGVGLSAKATACACSGFSASLTSNDTSAFSPNATANFTTETTSVADFSTTSTTESSTSFASTLAPCPEPLKVNCSSSKPFSFTIAKGQGFALKETSENTLLLHKKLNILAYDAEFTVDPKEFCVDGMLTEKAFSLHCDADGRDYLLSAENLQAGETTLATGACAAEGTIKQYFDCSKSDQLLKCEDNAKKACQNVQNFKLTVPPYIETVIPRHGKEAGSVFITEKDKSGKEEYRLFFTNYDKESKSLHVDVKTDCERMLDVPLEFECSGKQSAKIGFTLRQNLTATDGLASDFNVGACALQESRTHAERICSITFDSRSDCGGVLNAQPTCQDKMIMLLKGEDESCGSYIDLHAMTPESATSSASCHIEFVPNAFVREGKKCHSLKRKIKPDYRLRHTIKNHPGLGGGYSYITKVVPEIYTTVDIGYNSFTFTNDTTIPKGYEKPCGLGKMVVNNPEQKDKFLVPLCG